MVRILAVCMLLMAGCGKDKSTAVVIEEEEIGEMQILLHDGWNAIVDLDSGPFNYRILDYLTNRGDEYDARDMYSIISSGNGRIFLDLENVDDYPVPLYIWIKDLDSDLYMLSHFGVGQENIPIDTTYYGNRNLRFAVCVEREYRDIPPEDPEFDFMFSLTVRIP